MRLHFNIKIRFCELKEPRIGPKWCPVGRMDDYYQPGTTRAGLRILIMRNGT